MTGVSQERLCDAQRQSPNSFPLAQLNSREHRSPVSRIKQGIQSGLVKGHKRPVR